MMLHRTYEPHELRMIAAVADVDPRSVARMVAGKPVRPSTSSRVRAAMDALARENASPQRQDTP